MLENQLLTLLAIVFLGYALGNIKIYGISLGSSACIFVAMAAGALGAAVPPVVASLGIVFFVYSIGLQAGPKFFRGFGHRGIKFAVLAMVTIGSGAATALIAAVLLGVSPSGMAGVFAGAMTSTPALASAMDAIDLYLPKTGGLASLGYAAAYPFGLVSEILFMQLIPKIFKKKLIEERRAEAKEELERGFIRAQFKLTNANLAGKTLEELHIHEFCRVTLTRFRRGDHAEICLPSTVLQLGDVVVAVGLRPELDKFSVFFGEEIDVAVPRHGGFESRDIFVSGSQVVGKSLEELRLPEVYGINVTRLYRGDVVVAPTGSVVLEVGDYIKVAGQQDGVEQFMKIAGAEKRRLDDTNILLLAFGLFIGAILGEIPIEIGRFTFKLGLAGGALAVALVFGHFGRIGPWSVRVPNATKFFLRELGLVFFLIGIGVKTGAEIAGTAGRYDLFSFIALGAAVSLVSVLSSYVFVRKVLKLNIASSLGAVCGAKTSSPALGVLVRTLEDDSPAANYATVYPVAIIILTVIGQVLVWAGMNILR